MKKITLALLVTSTLFGCASTAMMVKTDAVAAQPIVPITVDGKFGGFGQQGTFKVADLYSGRFSRDATKSSWFGVVGSSDSDMVATIDSTSGHHWKIQCSGEQSSFNLGSIAMSDSDPFQCEITQDGTTVGHYQIKTEKTMLGASKELGFVTLNGTKIELAAVKKAEGSAFEGGQPLGYSFTLDGKEIAATQTNGSMTLQMLPKITEKQQDAIVVGSIASALSWRPDSDS
ncbi:VV20781 family protein [Vibrio comitans]